MKTELLTRSVYLTIVLIVTMAVSGCLFLPHTTYSGAKPGAIKSGKTTKAEVIRESDAPNESTTDGRFFLYRYYIDSEWGGFVIGVGVWDGLAASSQSARLLIEFDKNHIVKRRRVHRCEYEETVDPICDESSQKAMWMMIEELLGEDGAAQYRRTMELAESLAEPLRQALALGDLEAVKRLIAQGASVYWRVDGRTPLNLAAELGHKDVAELLIVKGADVNEKDKYGDTPLGLATQGHYKELVELLKQHGAKEGPPCPSCAT